MNRLLILTLILSLSCAHNGAGGSDKEPNLSDIERFPLGKPCAELVLRTLGSPERKIISTQNQSDEVWLYFSKGTSSTRVALVFDKTSLVLNEKTLFLKESDPEAKLQNAKARFPGAEFEQKNFRQTNPHFIPDEIMYTGKKHGVALTYRKATQFVESISWFDPNNRTVAGSSQNP